MTQLSDFYTDGLPSSFSNFIAGEAVQQGDLITQGTDGKAYWATDPSLSGAAVRPLNTFAAQSFGPVFPSANNIPNAYNADPNNQTFDVAVLSNNNVVNATLDATTATPKFSIYDGTSGALIAGPTYIETNGVTAAANISVIGLSGGGFAVAYVAAAGASHIVSGSAKFAVFDNSGNVVTAPAAMDGAVTNYNAIKIGSLTGSGFVVVGQNATSGSSLKFGRYNALGVLQGAVTVIDSAAYTTTVVPDAFNICSLNGGGFVVAWSEGASGNTFFSQFTSTGTSVVGKTSIAPVGTQSMVQCIGLTDGGYAVGAYVFGGVSTTVAPVIAKFNAAGAIVGASLTLDAIPAVSNLAYGIKLCPIFSGTFTGGYATIYGASNATGKALQYYVITAAGAKANAAAIAVDNSSGQSTVTSIALSQLSDGTILIIDPNPNSTPVGKPIYYKSDSTLLAFPISAVTFPTNIGAGQNSLLSLVKMVTLTNSINTGITTLGIFWQGFSTNLSGFNYFLSSQQKLSFVGVATVAAAQGATFRVQTLGSVPTRLNFSNPFVANYQPQGQRASLIGASAILYGVQSFSPRNIN